jgi:crotonobetaine/carnitine-CoA ligase
MLVTDLIEATAAGGDELRIIVDDAHRTRATVRAAAHCWATRLQQAGVLAGDRVAILSTSRMEVIEAFFGVAYAGAINVVINSFLKGDLLAYQLELTRPRIVIADPLGAKAISQVVAQLPQPPELIVLPDATPVDADLPSDAARFVPVPRSPADPVSIVFTSGTTGRSKGCVISHQYFVLSGRRMNERCPLGPGDLYHSPYPLFHIGGQCAVVSWGLGAGSSIALDSQFSASTYWDRVRELGATYSQGTGAVGAAILATAPSPRDRDNPLVRASFIPMAAEAQQVFSERFDVTAICEWYGQTELSPICVNLVWQEGGTCQGSMGFPLPDIEARIVDAADERVPAGTIGELIVRPRAPGIMFSGYWEQPEHTVAAWRDLWYRTGDLVVEAPDGSFRFVDRAKDSVRRSGENVSCWEVEQVLLRMPGVDIAAVHAVPAELIEDEIKAWIVRQEGAMLGANEFFAYCSSRLPYFAIPRYVEFADDLPRNALGKVLKDELRDAGATMTQVDLKALGLVVARDQRR